jgi:hypothetical protein
VLTGTGAKWQTCWKGKTKCNTDDFLMKKYCTLVSTVTFLPWYLSTEENIFVLNWERTKPVSLQMLIYINAGDEPCIDCYGQYAAGKTWSMTQKNMESNLANTSRHWEQMWGKLLRAGPGCIFCAHFASINTSYVKSKTSSRFHNTLICLHTHRRAWRLPIKNVYSQRQVEEASIILDQTARTKL